MLTSIGCFKLLFWNCLRKADKSIKAMSLEHQTESIVAATDEAIFVLSVKKMQEHDSWDYLTVSLVWPQAPFKINCHEKANNLISRKKAQGTIKVDRVSQIVARCRTKAIQRPSLKLVNQREKPRRNVDLERIKKLGSVLYGPCNSLIQQIDRSWR